MRKLETSAHAKSPCYRQLSKEATERIPDVTLPLRPAALGDIQDAIATVTVHSRTPTHSLDALVVFAITQCPFNWGEGPSLIWLVDMTTHCLDELRIKPYFGRFFHHSDDRGPNTAPSVVLTYAYWHSHFHDDHG